MPRQVSSHRLSIPDGAAGTRQTLKHMRQFVREGKKSLKVRHVANTITRQVPGKDWHGELAAILDYCRRNMRYSLDPCDIETVSGAPGTLQLGYGDCDDAAVLVATLCESVGHPCCLVALGFNQPGSFEHVVAIASPAGEQPWICMDATETRPFGWFPSGVVCEMVAPIDLTAMDAYERFGFHSGLQ